MLGACLTRRIADILIIGLLAGLLILFGAPQAGGHSAQRHNRTQRGTHSARSVEEFNGAYVASGELIVKFRKPLSRAFRRFLSGSKADLGTVSVQEIANDLNLYCVSVEGVSTASLIERFNKLLSLLSNKPKLADNSILYFEPNFLIQLEQRKLPNDLIFNGQPLWSLRNYTPETPGISAVSAWDKATGTTDVVVGVVDSGIDKNHPDLKDNIWEAPYEFKIQLGGRTITCPKGSYGFNVQAEGEEDICYPKDEAGHGTNVSGIIGARGNNGKGIVGVNWHTKLLGLRFTDDVGEGTACDAINAIEVAVQLKAIFDAKKDKRFNVRVLNNSYGYGCSSDVSCELKSMQEVIERANRKGILFVAAAGNDSSNNDERPHFPSDFLFLPNVLSVAATDSQDNLADFSNYGARSVNLGAPGKGIYTTWNWLDVKYKEQHGTSMATAFASGAAALMLSYRKCASLTPAGLKDALVRNVDKLDSLKGKTSSGGRLNVNLAMERCGNPLP
jgi:subtilisin family serine protease